jgi:hypothetical protein
MKAADVLNFIEAIKRLKKSEKENKTSLYET